MATAQSTLLGTEDLSRELDITRVEAQRLIARKRLKATRLGEDGKWRVRAADLDAYVAAGAKDLRLMETFSGPDLEPGYFDNSLTYHANTFQRCITDACDEQAPSDDALQRKFEDMAKDDNLKFHTSIDIEMKRIGKIAELCARPVPKTVTGNLISGNAESRFENWLDLFVTDTFRTNVRTYLNTDGDMRESPFTKLYDSPEEYARIVDAAWSQMMKRRIAASSKIFKINAGGFMPETRTAYLLFSFTSAIKPSDKTRYADLAF